MNNVLILDGGFSTQVSKYSTNYENHPLWTAYLLHKHCGMVFQTHLDYLYAGADIISTNTYQASIPGFQKYLDENLTEEDCIGLIKRAVKLASDARYCYQIETNLDKLILIAGSVGSYGAYVHDGSEYNGNFIKTTSIEEIKEWHIPRIETLIQSGVDLLAFETIPVSEEAEMLVKLLKNYPQTKAWVSFSCKDGKNLNSGENFQDVAKRIYDLNPDQIIGIGVNCTKPDYVESLFKNFNIDRVHKINLITYPNSGESYDVEKGWLNKEECKPLESFVKTWVDLGVKYIGGCCRTDVDTIKKIKLELKAIKENK